MSRMEIKRILSDTISALCKSSLSFKEDIQIEGLIGITIDKRDIILVNINECFDISEKKPQKLPFAKDTNETKEATLTKPEKDLLNKEKEIPKPSNTENQKILSETSHKQCLQSDENGYTEVQKSIKVVQRPEGVVEQKEMEWKKYTADGELLEQRKVENVQPLNCEDDSGGAPSSYNNDDAFDCYEEEYEDNDNNFSQQYHQYSRPSNRGFARGANSSRGTKRQATAQSSAQQHFPKRSRGEHATPQKGGRRSQFEHFPYTKVVLQKADVPRGGGGSRKGASSSGASSKGKSNVQPNDVIFNNALDLVWKGKMSVNAAVEMFNLPEMLFRRHLSVSKSRRGGRGGRGKAAAAAATAAANDDDDPYWEEGGGYDDDAEEYGTY